MVFFLDKHYIFIRFFSFKVPSEEDVFEAVMVWIKYNIEDRKEYLPSLLEHVRLSLLTPQYLTDVIDNEVSVDRNQNFFF